MKCPGCGTDMGAKQVCSKCGFNNAGNQDEIEVEYKDFKTSELLEIRQKRQAAPVGQETKTDGKLTPNGPEKPSPDSHKSSFPVAARVALMLLLLALAFVLFRHFLLK